MPFPQGWQLAVVTAAILAIAGACAVFVYRWIWPRGLDVGQRVLDEFDEVLRGDDACTKLDGKRMTSKMAIEASIQFKEEFGECSDSKANRLLAFTKVRDWMRETHPDMRKVDLLLHVPMAVELCFIPTEASVVAASWKREAAIIKRKQAITHSR